MEYSERIVLGRSTAIIFPSLGGEEVPAKVDTGAYGSVIHAQNITIKEDESGHVVLSCTLLNHATSPRVHDEIKFNKFDKVVVTSSLGHSEERYRVSLPVEIRGLNFVTEFTLSDRSHAVFPVLLGRRALRTRFVVDVCKKGFNYQHLMDLTKDNTHWVTAQQLKEEL